MRGRERDGSFQQHFERGTWIGVGDDFVTPHDGGTVRGQDVTRVVDGGGGVHDAGDAQRLELGDELCGAGVVDVDDARGAGIAAGEEFTVRGAVETARRTGIAGVGASIALVGKRPLS